MAAVWSCAPATAHLYPARYLFAFLANHGMLSITGSPRWRTVVGGSRTYVERLAKNLSAVLTATPVRAVRRLGRDGVEITADSDTVVRYDGVVVATHPDQALRLLADPTQAERDILGAFEYSPNDTLLHTDVSLLPRAPAAQASWNYRMADCHEGADQVIVTYDMTRLQRLETTNRYLVSLGSRGHIDPELVVDEMTYAHPIFSPGMVAAQRRLPELTTAAFTLAGAWHGWGFHEDGARSGLAAAEALGGRW